MIGPSLADTCDLIANSKNMSKQGRKANAEANAEVIFPMSSLTHTQVIITFRDSPAMFNNLKKRIMCPSPFYTLQNKHLQESSFNVLK